MCLLLTATAPGQKKNGEQAKVEFSSELRYYSALEGETER